MFEVLLYTNRLDLSHLFFSWCLIVFSFVQIFFSDSYCKIFPDTLWEYVRPADEMFFGINNTKHAIASVLSKLHVVEAALTYSLLY